MKRILSLILCVSVLVSCMVFSQSTAVSAITGTALSEINDAADTLKVTDVTSFRYAVPKLATSSGTLNTQFVKNTSITTPGWREAAGWDGACVISSIDGSLSGPVAGKATENFTLQWINRSFILDNNTVMFYVELPDYAAAGANWALSLNSFYINQDNVNFWSKREAPISYSFISKSYDRWQFAETTTVDGNLAVFSKLPSGFKGYVRIDLSSSQFHPANGVYPDFSRHYMLINMGFGFNAVGGDCGDLIFGGVLYYPDDDNNYSTLMELRDCYYQLGGNKDAVLVTAHASRWNVTVSNPSGGDVIAANSNYTASCPGGGNGVMLDSTTGEAIDSIHMYSKMWPNTKMQPGVDTFMMYVELPTFEADTPALYISMPGIQQGSSWPSYVDPVGAQYYYADVNGSKWQRGIVGSNGELAELKSGFKGYIKFSLKDFSFYGNSSTVVWKNFDFTKFYNVENYQFRFNHVGGANGPLVIGSFYSVIADSDSVAVTGVSATAATAEAFGATSLQAVNATLNARGATLTKDNNTVQIASDKATGFDGIYRVSGSDENAANGSLVMQSVNKEVNAGNGIMFYAELPDYKKADTDWGLCLSSVKLTQNSKSYTAKLTDRLSFSYLSLTGSEWQEGTIRNFGGTNAVLTGLPAGFKGYICIDVAKLDFNENYSFDVYSNYIINELSLGFNGVSEESGDFVFGGILYLLNRTYNLETKANIAARNYNLTKNANAMTVSTYYPRHNVTITNTTGGTVDSEATYTTIDSVGNTADKAVVLGSISGNVITDLHMYSKNWANTNMQPGVDTFMVYIEMPNYTEEGPALYISQPSFASTYIDWKNGKYSYMSIYDGEWKSAALDAEGGFADIPSGFKGYVKMDIKTFAGFDTFKTKVDVTQPYQIINLRFRYRYVGGDNGNLIIGNCYTVVEDSDAPFINVVNNRRKASTRIVYGDLVPNGAVDADDMILVRKAILGIEEVKGTALERADANADGTVFNVKDLVRMKKIAAGAVAANKWADYTNNSSLTISKWLDGGVIPYYTEGTVTETEAGDGTKIMTAVGTTAATYNQYLKALEYVGFELYTTNTIENNLFATYTNENLTVNAYYIDSNKTVRVVWEPKTYLPGLASENIYNTSVKVDTRITGMNLDASTVVEGMCFIIRLEDNSFIVFDGGYAAGNNRESKNLYDILVAQTPAGQKPVIAAWIFSHAHSDHVGNFNEFALNYHDDVVIEKFYYNFPSDKDIAANSPGIMGTTLKEYGITKVVMDEYYYDTPVIKVHTGNKFYVRNAEFEVLQTFEDFAPTILPETNFNNSTTIFRMYVGGQSTLWLGDALPAAEALMVEQFGDYLKSDVLQLAHHGIDGSLSAYQVYDPTYCLWPGAKQFYYQYNTSAHNNWLLKESPNVKQTIVTGFGTYTTKLPIDIKGDYPEHIYENTYVNPSYID